MASLNVLLTGPSLEKTVGGIAIHIQTLLRLFKDHHGVRVGHFAITDAKYNQESWFSKIRRIVRLLLPFVVRARSYDIVHLNSTFDNKSVARDFLFAAIAKAICRKRVIIQFHGGEPSKVFFFRNVLFRLLCRAVLVQVDDALALSIFQRDQFLLYFPRIKVTLVPNCIDAAGRNLKKEDPDSVVFLFIGRIEVSKGIFKILDAAKMLMDDQLKFKINICGDGKFRQKFIEEVVSKGLDKHVEYLGFVSGSEKKEILRQSNVMLLPTDHNEGFPYALLEAFSYAMPVIGTHKGAIPEVIEDGRDGFVIFPNNTQNLYKKMVYFCRHPEEIDHMGNLGYEKLLMNYNSRILQEKLFSIYQR